MPITEEQRANSASEHFANYQEYNKTLRTWFVTFGLGAPALFLVNDKLWPKFDGYAHHTRVIVYYLAGCAAQVGVTMINKVIAWHNYDDFQTIERRRTRRHRLCRSLENAFWIDMAADCGTAAAFAYATMEVVKIFAR